MSTAADTQRVSETGGKTLDPAQARDGEAPDLAGFPSSWLFVPGNRPERFAKAAASGAEAIIIDLEDAVAPDAKPAARNAVAAFLALPRETGASAVAVRINTPDTVAGLRDLAMLAVAACDFVVVPKAECGNALQLIARVLADGGNPARLVALVESARGVARAAELAGAGPAMAALMFGAADYASDLGLRVGATRSDFARATIVNAAASGGLEAIDSPFFDLEDERALAAESAAAVASGFAAKAAIHPAQVAAIRAAFAPSAEDIALARTMLAAAIDGVGIVGGKMIDGAMLRWARRVTARA